MAPPDFGLSTISAISTGTSLLYSEENHEELCGERKQQQNGPVKATAEDGSEGQSRAG